MDARALEEFIQDAAAVADERGVLLSADQWRELYVSSVAGGFNPDATRQALDGMIGGQQGGYQQPEHFYSDDNEDDDEDGWYDDAEEEDDDPGQQLLGEFVENNTSELQRRIGRPLSQGTRSNRDDDPGPREPPRQDRR
jgi:hypothetical protein